MLAAFAALLLWIVHLGHAYDGLGPGAAPSGEDSPVGLLYDTLTINLKHPLSLLLLQVIAILITVRIFSYLFKYLGQPGVIGEIVAGIVLGPSVLGHLSPETFAFLFDPDSLVPLNIISQIGLVPFWHSLICSGRRQIIMTEPIRRICMHTCFWESAIHIGIIWCIVFLASCGSMMAQQG